MKRTRSSTSITSRGKPRARTSATVFCFCVVVSVLLASVLYTSSSASTDVKLVNPPQQAKLVAAGKTRLRVTENSEYFGKWFAPVSIPPLLAPDTTATFEVVGGACTNTLKSSFALGESVCVRASGPVGQSRLSVDYTEGTVADIVDVTADPQELIFQLPTTTTSVVNGAVIDNRGRWRATLHSNTDFTSRSAVWFSVSDPANAAADLVISASSTATDTVAPGTATGFNVFVKNDGPDPAAAVHVTQNVPANFTFASVTAEFGVPFTCAENAGVVDCTPSGSLTAGDSSSFILNYDVSGGASNALLNTEIDVSSTTTDPHPESNASSATLEIRDPGTSPPTCSVSCPLNRTVGANTTQGGQPGALVDFSGDIEPTGDCGAVTASPTSGSFFPVGTTTVTVSSASGGGGCSFTITVTEVPAPTISCAADQTATITGSTLEASVTVNTPTATGNNVQVTGTRNDNRSLSDGYPIGTTTITWTAQECNNLPACDDPNARFASCTQRIIVTSPDAPTISCPANKNLPATDCAGRTLTTGDIGSPSATGSNVTITSRRSDDLDLTNDPYPVGVTTITWTATDGLGRVASCTQTITIASSGADSVPPTLNVPADVSATTNSCSALLDDELGVATASDNCGTVSISRTGVPTFACPTPSDPNKQCESFVFPVGTTDVTYTATDNAGNVTTGVQHVTVLENTPPIFTSVPANVTVSTGPGATSCGVVVDDATLGTATVADNCDTTVIRTGVPAGNNFPVGATTITYTAKANPSVTATQIVTVIDDTLPVVTAPAAVTLFTGPGATSCGITVADLDAALGTGSATDNCAGLGPVTRTGVPTGNSFPVGTTTLTYSATDAHGNTASATQVVTVVDNTPPIVTAPAAITLFTGPGATSCGVTVANLDGTLGVGSATDNCAGVGSVTRSGVPAGNSFPTGTTTVTYSATDANGNTASATQVVTVVDNTAPVISCPANITLEPSCPLGAIATYSTPTATDNCGVQSVNRTAGPASGSVFPIGTTTVTHTATDIYGNTASCSFTVTVLTPQAVINNLSAAVNASSLTGTQKNGLLAKLSAALSAINSSQTNVACNKLSDFVNSVGTLISHGDLTAAQGNAWISSANHVRNTIGCTSLPCS